MRNLLFIFVSIVALVFNSGLGFAEEGRYIEVIGAAAVEVRPDSFRITAILSVEDEKSYFTALKKFEESKNKFNTALNPMVFEKVAVDYQQTQIGNGIGSQEQQVMIAMGGGETDSEAKFVVKESALVKRSGLDAMTEEEVKRLVAKLSDTIVKNGGTLGPETNNMFGWNLKQGSVTYSISDPTTHIFKAQSAAMKNAKSRATDLAKLAGGKIGRVLFVKEASLLAGGSDAQTDQAIMMLQASGIDMQKNDLSADSFRDISVRSSLKVRFELLDE